MTASSLRMAVSSPIAFSSSRSIEQTWLKTSAILLDVATLPPLLRSSVSSETCLFFSTRGIVTTFAEPSVIGCFAATTAPPFGFFGVAIIVPFIRDHIGGHGNSLLAATIVLTLMILPTVINLAEAAIRSIPNVYYEGAMALGCNKTEAVFEIVVPSAKSGINSAYILGIGRAVGETMAVIMVAGNAPIFPDSLLGPVRTLTTAIALEMSYATGLHRDVLFGIGVVLFLIIIILNATLTLMNRNATNFAKES